MTETPTSYSLLVMFKDVIYAVRDPYGNRPLCIGQLVPISKLHNPGIYTVVACDRCIRISATAEHRHVCSQKTSFTDKKDASREVNGCSRAFGLFDFVRGQMCKLVND